VSERKLLYRILNAIALAAVGALPVTPAQAAAAENPAPPAAASPEALAAWLAASITSAGWELVDLSQGEGLYIQGVRAQGGGSTSLRVHARWEGFYYPSPDHPWRSALQLLDVDCKGRRFREVSWTAYTGSNFSGSVVTQDDTGDDWRTVAVDSLMDSALAVACGEAPGPAAGPSPAR